MLPKTCLLHATKANWHCFIFSKSLFIGMPEASVYIQESRIICSHSGCDTHFSSNWWSLCCRRGVGIVAGVASSNIGS